jgi:hypothetical protein
MLVAAIRDSFAPVGSSIGPEELVPRKFRILESFPQARDSHPNAMVTLGRGKSE